MTGFIQFIPRLLLAVGAMSIVACSTPDKAALPLDADPRAELQKLDADQEAARTSQYDMLSPGSFKKSVEYRDSAWKRLEKNKDRGDILEDIAVSRRFLEKALSNGKKYESSVQPVLEARRHALDAQANNYVRKAFENTDENFADVGDDMEDDDYTINASVISGLEGEYRRHEMEARKIAVLDPARKNLDRAADDGARKKTPNTYEMTKALIVSAERAIETSPRDPAGYTAQVDKAGAAAQKLREVLAIANGRAASEGVALTIWEQDQKLRASQEEIQSSQAALAAEQERMNSQLTAQQSALQNQSRTLSAEQQRNAQYAEKEGLRQKIEELRKRFSEDEAEVLKEGSNLVVRLKKVNFSTGRAEVNPDSYSTLKKVQDLIAAVPAETIVVQGHTDSTGSPAKNQVLSEKRAESVKEYLSNAGTKDMARIEAKGFGAEKPLTSNRTKEGRATNRRVDIVIETATTL